MELTIIILVIILFLFTLASFISTIKNNIYQAIAEEKEDRIKDQNEQLELMNRLIIRLDNKNEQLKKEIERLKKNKRISESRKRKEQTKARPTKNQQKTNGKQEEE